MDEVWLEIYLSARFPEGVKEDRDMSTNNILMMLGTKGNILHQNLSAMTSQSQDGFRMMM